MNYRQRLVIYKLETTSSDKCYNRLPRSKCFAAFRIQSFVHNNALSKYLVTFVQPLVCNPDICTWVKRVDSFLVEQTRDVCALEMLPGLSLVLGFTLIPVISSRVYQLQLHPLTSICQPFAPPSPVVHLIFLCWHVVVPFCQKSWEFSSWNGFSDRISAFVACSF